MILTLSSGIYVYLFMRNNYFRALRAIFIACTNNAGVVRVWPIKYRDYHYLSSKWWARERYEGKVYAGTRRIILVPCLGKVSKAEKWTMTQKYNGFTGDPYLPIVVFFLRHDIGKFSTHVTRSFFSVTLNALSRFYLNYAVMRSVKWHQRRKKIHKWGKKCYK